MKVESIGQRFTEYWHSFYQWVRDTPERSLLAAYQAAEAIRNIEIEQFSGKKISSESANYSENVMDYWQGNLNRNLATIKIKLAQFNLSITFINPSKSILLEQLNFIDEVIKKYIPANELINNGFMEKNKNANLINKNLNSSDQDIVKLTGIKQKNGVIPISLEKTIDSLTRNLSPQAEEDFIKNYRINRNRTRRAIKFLLLLVIIPILTQNFAQKFVVSPILININSQRTTPIFLNLDMENEALNKFRIYGQQLRFEQLLRQAPEMTSPEIIPTKLKNKAIEIAAEFRNKSNKAISNLFADFISLIAFSLVIVFSKKDIVFVKYFIDSIIYGLSDSAKAFLIILFTDIFVGFHSPHGWEIILEGLAEHLGLPANRNAIFTFIATFPVILDTIFKYWIFRYLSRLSPSALATLKEMDE
ncbi:proton extrusion protein PcxA [Cronbergia sp. UHCC 0137]|uniref:proton extrusion protein PcxA n=1 Tax=Cronbergia sp. UHCC 0137 TaxID=3110239 RepID=UPI002B202ABC|nr:proton extrusion protein PcxA [Cronbergia sp. UHCC 0137]MEA5616995.1 proton extrusion protein PcxA [Cronbergia sp. UHCC 0137]